MHLFTCTMGEIMYVLCLPLLALGIQGYENIAFNRPTEQSSTYISNSVNTSATKAVDGNTDQRFYGDSCARTNLKKIVWWRVDLEGVKSVYSIKVFYRNDSDEHVGKRQATHAGFSLYVSNTTELKEGFLCYKNNDTLPSLLSEHKCTQHGRYVTYYNERGDGVIVPLGSRPRETIADLCEVQVFGCRNTGVYGEKCNIACPENCQEGNCHIVTGDCLGCIDGWRGKRCSEKCFQGFYGKSCAVSCSILCKTRTCHHVTGECDCQLGWAGTNCSLNVTGNPNYTDASGMIDFEKKPINQSQFGVAVGVCAALIIIIVIVLIFIIRRKLLMTKDDLFSSGIFFSALKSKQVDDDEEEEMTDPHAFAYNNTVLKDEKEEGDTKVYDNLPVSDLLKIIQVMSRDENAAFKKEYMNLPKGELFPCDEAKQPENVPRNRYKTTFPYDHSRVVLQCSSPKESNYINANYIENVDGEKVYIATQGPKAATVPDFWRMVWQENTTKIVNVTNLKEGSKIKCDKYWPDRGHSYKKGDIKIQNLEETVYANYVIRKLKVTTKSSSEIRVVYMFHYTEWPDHDVPEALNLVIFHRHVMRTSQSQTKAPVIVHCSAGIGRTGTFIALDALYRHGMKSGKINIPEYVKTMRKDRMNMIQSHEQYKMVYETLHEAFRAKQNLVYRDKFVDKYGDIKSNTSEATSQLEAEFKTLKDIKPVYEDTDFKTAKENLDKNFSQDVLPVDKYLCHLSYVKGQNNYYNAVLLQSYTKPDDLLSAQFPADSSAESLFRLIKDFEASILVALSPLTDMESVYTNSFLPQAQSSTTVGSFTLTHKSSSKSNDVSKSSLVIKKKGSKEMHLEVFECARWQTTDWMSDPRVMVDLLKEVKMSQYARPSTSIVVLSSDGATRTGVFCTVFNALEELTIDNDVDIFTIARQLQIRRPEFLSDIMEYKFCYEVVYEYLKNDMVYANC